MSGEDPVPKIGRIRQFIRSTFGFRKTTLTFLVVLTYLITALLDFSFEKQALRAPSPEPKILTKSWADLQQISSDFHPYTSPANDEVHDYLLNRIKTICDTKSFLNYSDDWGNVKTMINQQEVFDPTSSANRIIYFESGNILVKIQGKNPSLEGLLISAHYDSVPTAYGTTDDGMGIASMIGILEHFSAKEVEQPDRTIILNFNDDEEFGLLGAEMFFQHEWSALVKVFINLEGTGAGGRAILFRSTDNGVLSYYKNVEKPFANSLFQQGFQSGLIRSETDYKIYYENGLRGVDIAFFKPRSLYHTKRDSISGTTKGSLWHMEKNALDMTLAFAYDIEPLNKDKSKGAYFDILGLYFFNISVDILYVLNVLIITIVPFITLFFLLVVYKRGTWFVDVGRGWLRYPISLVLAWSITSFAGKYIYIHDPLLLSNDFVSPYLALASLNILLNYIFLNFVSWLRPVHDQKLIGILELNCLTWLCTIWVTVKQKQESNVAGIPLTIIYLLTSIASIVGLLSLVIKAKPPKYTKKMNTRVLNYGSTTTDEIAEASCSTESSTGNLQAFAPADNAVDSENHPLLNGLEGAEEEAEAHGSCLVIVDHETRASYEQRLKEAALKSFSYDWSLQYLILVPISVFLVYTQGGLILQALHQTAQENKQLGKTTLEFLLGIAIWLGIPLLPFVHKLNALIVLFFALTFFVFSSISYLEPPFSLNNPLKLRFIESIDLTGVPNIHTNETVSVSPVVSLFGRQGYIESVLADIPSMKQYRSTIECSSTNNKTGTETCTFEGKRPWLVDGTSQENKLTSYFNIEVLKDTNDGKKSDKYSPYDALFNINIENSRACVLSFNSSKYDSFSSAHDYKMVSPVKLVTLYNPDPSSPEEEQTIPFSSIPSGYSTDEEGNHYYKLMKGIDQIQLHKLNFTQSSFKLGIQWLPFSFDDDDDLEGGISKNKLNLGVNVKCYWGEYDNYVIVDGEKKRMLPAFDELLSYSPNYISYSNLAMGLVEIERYVEL